MKQATNKRRPMQKSEEKTLGTGVEEPTRGGGQSLLGSGWQKLEAAAKEVRLG